MRNVFADEEDSDSQTWASYPSFDRRHLRAIELALRAAWDQLHKIYAMASELSAAGEVRISTLLRKALNELRERRTGGIEGFNCSIFERPQLGPEMETPEGKMKKPDIVIALSGNLRLGSCTNMVGA